MSEQKDTTEDKTVQESEETIELGPETDLIIIRGIN